MKPMGKVVIGAEVKVDGLDRAGQSVGSFKKQLREATNDLIALSEKFGVSSVEAQNAAKRVAELRDTIGDAKALADTFNPDKKFVALGGAIQGIASGFSAFTGLLGTFGDEGKEVEQMLLKVNAAMALQQGISGIAGAVDSFKLLGNVIVEKAVTAFSTLGGAMRAAGIGLVISGIAYLVSNLDELKEALGFATKAQQAYNDTMEDYQDGAKDAILKVNEVKVAFDQAKGGVISKKEALEIYNNTLGDTLGKAKTLDEAETIYSKKAGIYIQIMGLKAQANALFAKSADEMAKGIVSANNDQTSFFDKAKASVYSFFGFTTKALESITEAQQAGASNAKQAADKNARDLFAIGEQLANQAQQLAKDNQININEAEVKEIKKGTDSKAEELRKQLERLAELRREYRAKEDAAIQEYGAQLAAADAAQNEAEIQRLKDNEQRRLDTKLALAELALLNDPDSIENKIAKANADFELEMLNFDGNEIQRQVKIKQHEDEITQLKKEGVDARKQLIQEEINQVVTGLGAIGGALDAFAEVAGRQSAEGKALSIAATVIKTIQGGVSAFMGVIQQIPGPVGIALGAVAAAGVVASGYASIRKMQAVPIPGKGGSSAVGVPPAPAAPILPKADSTRLDQDSINAVGNAASRAFVLETDVTNNQERIKRLNRVARIN